MAQLPADRTKLTAAQGNQVATAVASASKNIQAITEVYDTVDLLNSVVSGLLATDRVAQFAIYNVRQAPYNAVGDGVADDSAAIQAAINAANAAGGGIVYLPYKPSYKIVTGITIPGDNITIMGNRSALIYTGTGTALDAALVGGTRYPVNLNLLDLAIGISAAGAKGIRWRFSHSFALNSGVGMSGNNQIAWEFPGDPSGTGPYYNTVMNPKIQGQADSGKTSQEGFKFTSDASSPGRCPNTNTIIGGRVGQTHKAVYLTGIKNRIIGLTCEGTITTVFEVNHSSIASGADSNSIEGVYIEGASGANSFVIGVNADYTVIEYPYMTSMGAGTPLTDNSLTTTALIPGVIMKISARGYELRKPSSADSPKVKGVNPAWVLEDTSNASSVTIANNSAVANIKQFSVFNTIEYLMQFGTNASMIKASNLTFENGSVGIYLGTGTPEGILTAPIGSVYFRKDGGALTSHYVKETGTGNTGWVAK